VAPKSLCGNDLERGELEDAVDADYPQCGVVLIAVEQLIHSVPLIVRVEVAELYKRQLVLCAVFLICHAKFSHLNNLCVGVAFLLLLYTLWAWGQYILQKKLGIVLSRWYERGYVALGCRCVTNTRQKQLNAEE